MCWIQRGRIVLKKKKQKLIQSQSHSSAMLWLPTRSEICWTASYFSSHMFLIDTPGYQPCPFLTAIPDYCHQMERPMCNCAGSGWSSVSLNTADMDCILVGLKEFCFVLLAVRFWPIKLHFGPFVLMEHVDRKRLWFSGYNHAFVLQRQFIQLSKWNVTLYQTTTGLW